jgi:nucleoid DNA-binding protein
MPTPTAKDVIRAFARIVREQLVRGESAYVPGLGTFTVEHEPSRVVMPEGDGSPSMQPPRDVVRFQPE